MPTAHPHPWHRGSLFGNGARRPLDRNQRARFRYLLRAHTTAGRITPKGEWAGEALLKHVGIDGRCDPSHATLAADARGIDPSTVRDALKAMHRCGLVTWQRRIVRNGERIEQTSNAYVLLPTSTHSTSVEKVDPHKKETYSGEADRCGMKSQRGTSLVDKSTRLPSVTEWSNDEIAAARKAMAQRRRVIQQRLLSKGRAAPA